MRTPRTALTIGFLTRPFGFTPSGRGDAQAPRKGGRAVVVSAQEPKTLLPHLDLLTLSREVQRLVFDGLLTAPCWSPTRS
jgi:hypothetical protein